jgi:hypothetical protein
MPQVIKAFLQGGEMVRDELRDDADERHLLPAWSGIWPRRIVSGGAVHYTFAPQTPV